MRILPILLSLAVLSVGTGAPVRTEELHLVAVLRGLLDELD